MKYLLLPFIFCVLICVSSEKARYDKYRVYKIIIDDRKQLETLKLLADTSDSVIIKNMCKNIHICNRIIATFFHICTKIYCFLALAEKLIQTVILV